MVDWLLGWDVVLIGWCIGTLDSSYVCFLCWEVCFDVREDVSSTMVWILGWMLALWFGLGRICRVDRLVCTSCFNSHCSPLSMSLSLHMSV